MHVLKRLQSGISLSLILMMVASLLPFNADAAIRETLTYQAKIVDSNFLPPIDGSYSFRFRIYDSLAGGLLLWEEDHTGGGQLAVENGVVTVELNSVCGDWDSGGCISNGGVDFSTDSLYLEMQWDADGAGGTYEEVFAPRRRLTAAAYAQMAAGLTTDIDVNFIDGSNRSIQWDEAAERTLTIENDDGSNVANLAVEGQVQTGSFASAPTAIGNGAFYYDTGTNELFAQINGSWTALGNSGSITLDTAYNNFGATASTITIDAAESQTGGLQFVGSLASDETISITNSGNGGVLFIENTGTGDSFRVDDESSDTTPFVIDDEGNVGIGTATPSALVQATTTDPSSLTQAGLYEIEFASGTSASRIHGLNGQNTLSGSRASTGGLASGGGVIGVEGTVNIETTGTNTDIAGVLGNVQTNAVSIGSVTNAAGTMGLLQHNTTGTISVGIGTGSIIENTSTGTITNAFGHFVDSIGNTGGGTVTAAYGLFVSDQTVGSVSSYGVFVTGGDTAALHVASDDVQFLDNLFVGATTETLNNSGFTLDGDDVFVSGDVGIEGDIYTDGTLIIDGAEDTTLITFNDTTNADSVSMYTGTGSPDGALSAQAGSLFLDQAGLLHVNTDGGTGWSNLNSALTLTMDQTYNNFGANPSTVTVDASESQTGGLQFVGSLGSDETITVSNSAAGGTLFVENTGAGSSFRVDDIASDTTPFVIDESGEVGIGTTTPTDALFIADGNATISRSDAADLELTFDAQNNSTAWTIGVEDSSDGNFLISNAADLSDPILFIGGDSGSNDGQVGVGTSSPIDQLTIITEAAGGNNFGLNKYTDDTNSANFNYRKARGTETTPTNVQAGDFAANFRGYGYVDGDFRTLANIRFGVEAIDTVADSAAGFVFFGTKETTDPAFVERLRITANGNTGVGTSTPDVLFHIEEDDAINTASTSVLRLTHTTSGTPTAGIGVGLEFEVEDAVDNQVAASIEGILTDVTNGAEEGALVFYTADIGDDGLAERMRIDMDGEVGIGTNNPGSLLDVAGTAAIDQIDLDDKTTDPTLVEGLLWFRSDNDNLFLRADGRTQEVATVAIGQFYDSDGNGGTFDVNGASYVAIDWDSETFAEDATYSHDTVTNPSRVTVNDDGLYKISYQVLTESQGGRRNVRCAIRLDGTTIVTEGHSFSYTRNATDEWGSNVGTAIVSLNASQYYEIICRGEGSGGTSFLTDDSSGEGASSTMIELLRRE